MQADCSAAQLHFEGFGKRQVVGAFDGGAVTSNAGAILLREADRALGLIAKVARCFSDGRAAELVVHRLETLVAQRVHAIALGYEDINDHDELRHDPVLGLLSDTLEPKRADVAPLAGKSTLNRLEHGLKSAMSRYHKISVIDAAMEEVFLELYASSSTSMRRTIRCTAARKAVSSTAIIAATATSRSTSSTGATCSLLSSGRPISTPRLARRRRSRASCRTCVRPGRRWRSG